jgi:diketogulonate reductase-like aldo/keto reductase
VESLVLVQVQSWTNPQIPQIGFGVYQSPPEIVDKSVTAALEAGYRHIDSAQWYFNEEEVGSAVSKSSVNRKDVFLTTKLGHADKVAERLEESITKIGGDGGYVDLFLIHAPSAGPEKRKEQWKEMEKLVKDGKAKAIGVSN